MESRPTILILGAFDPEISRLKAAADGRVLRGMDGVERRCVARACGVGNTRAALGLRDAVGEFQPSEILFLGSAGRYRSSVVPASVVIGMSVEFYNFESAVLSGDAHCPDLLENPVRARAGSFADALARSLDEKNRTENSVSFARGACNCPDSISQTELEPTRYGLDFENMEGYGLALAAGAEIPFAAFFALTNQVGPAGSIEWRARHVELGARLQAVVLEALGVSGTAAGA